MSEKSLAKSVSTMGVLLVSALTLALTPTAAAAQQTAGATMVVSAQVIRPAVPAATLDLAVAHAVASSAVRADRAGRVKDLPGGAQVTAQTAADSSRTASRHEVRIEYVAN